MTKKNPVIYAFIDSQNLNLSIRDAGWKLDFSRFRRYLSDKYHVTKAHLFVGYVDNNTALYTSLQRMGYICIFKPTLQYKDGTTKGNVDAELVLHAAAIEFPHYDQAIIVSGDGDFYCLVDYLLKNKKLSAVFIPNQDHFSGLLKFKLFRPYLRYMNELRSKLEYVKKKPWKDKTLQGTFSVGDYNKHTTKKLLDNQVQAGKKNK